MFSEPNFNFWIETEFEATFSEDVSGALTMIKKKYMVWHSGRINQILGFRRLNHNLCEPSLNFSSWKWDELQQGSLSPHRSPTLVSMCWAWVYNRSALYLPWQTLRRLCSHIDLFSEGTWENSSWLSCSAVPWPCLFTHSLSLTSRNIYLHWI